MIILLSNDINELAQNKLIILYVLSSSPYNFNNEKLTNFFLNNDIMNFFLIKQYVSELINAELISSDSNGNYYLTDLGTTSLDLFIQKIPKDLMEKIKSHIDDYNKGIKLEKEVQGIIEEDSFGKFNVALKLIENHQDIFKIELSASSREEADLIVKNWKKNIDSIYLSTLESLYSDDNLIS